MIRRFVLPLAAVLVWLLFSVTAWAADPLVRAQVQTQGRIVVGQQVTVSVDVLVPNFFLSPPKFPQLDIPNALVLLQDGAQNLVETIDGNTFAGIRRTYAITPQAPGEFNLPQAQITFAYAAVPGQPPVNGSVTLPAEKFTVAGVPGAQAGGASTVAAKVTMTQTLDRDPKKLAAGDTLVRTVTIHAEGMQAMLIPEPEFTAPDGVRLYRHDPRLTDEKGRQSEITGGTRTDTLTYAFTKTGDYTLPAVEVRWFDPASGKNEVASAPAVIVQVATAPAFKPAIAPPQQAAEPSSARQLYWLRYGALAVAAMVLLAAIVWVAARSWSRLAAWRAARRDKREHSEASYFKRFEQTCRTGDGMAVYASLDSWSRRAGVSPLSVWLRRIGEPSAQREYESFEGAVFGAGSHAGAWNPRLLAEGMSRARTAWLRHRASSIAPPPALPELNP